ncbi:MAG: hypothetical protein AAF250_01270 [Pseudomonadota bacterium]
MLASARDIWASSIPAARTLGLPYLEQLGCDLDDRSVRFNLSCHPVGAARGRTAPAVIFAFRAGDRIVGVERHFIDPDLGSLVSRDFVGVTSQGCWLTGSLRINATDRSFGMVCITQGIERALDIASNTGMVCAALQDLSAAKNIVFPDYVYMVCIDGQGLEHEIHEVISYKLRTKAYIVESLEGYLSGGKKPTSKLTQEELINH